MSRQAQITREHTTTVLCHWVCIVLPWVAQAVFAGIEGIQKAELFTAPPWSVEPFIRFKFVNLCFCKAYLLEHTDHAKFLIMLSLGSKFL